MDDPRIMIRLDRVSGDRAFVMIELPVYADGTPTTYTLDPGALILGPLDRITVVMRNPVYCDRPHIDPADQPEDRWADDGV